MPDRGRECKCENPPRNAKDRTGRLCKLRARSSDVVGVLLGGSEGFHDERPTPIRIDDRVDLSLGHPDDVPIREVADDPVKDCNKRVVIFTYHDRPCKRRASHLADARVGFQEERSLFYALGDLHVGDDLSAPLEGLEAPSCDGVAPLLVELVALFLPAVSASPTPIPVLGGVDCGGLADGETEMHLLGIFVTLDGDRKDPGGYLVFADVVVQVMEARHICLFSRMVVGWGVGEAYFYS